MTQVEYITLLFQECGFDTTVQRAAFLHREFGDHYEKPITYADALTPSDRSRLIEILKDVKAGQRK